MARHGFATVRLNCREIADRGVVRQCVIGGVCGCPARQGCPSLMSRRFRCVDRPEFLFWPEVSPRHQTDTDS
jgi:hypothetical protein